MLGFLTRLANRAVALEQWRMSIACLEGLVEAREALGETDRQTLAVRLRMSDSHARLDQHERALAIRQDVARLRSKSLGPDHSDTITAVGRVAQSLSALGRFDSLREKFEELSADHRSKSLQDEIDPQLLEDLKALGYI